jgi:hypothetical protein
MDHHKFTGIDVPELEQQLRLLRMKSFLAIVVGDCRAVARLTCKTARLRDALRLARTVASQVALV